MSELDRITTLLGQEYKQWKTSEKTKDGIREEFFDAATKTTNNLSERYVIVPHSLGMTEEGARAACEQYYSRWNVGAIRVCSDGWEAILIEKPEYQTFSYVNHELGLVFTKQVNDGAPMLDDELLKAEDPDLYKEVTAIPFEGWIKDVMYHCGVDGNDVDDELEKYLTLLSGGPERKLKNLESLDTDTLAKLSDYIYEGQPTVKLAAPRKAKEEELG